MRAITLNHYGNADVLTLSDIPQPIPGPQQILVQVKAFALNRADILQRLGKYPPPPGESDILGLEIAGVIVAMGMDVTGFGVGEHVFGLVGSGAYAEYCLIDQAMTMVMPENLSFTEAAAIPEAFLTAQEAIFSLGQLQKKESILIHAGASGVGTAAIQMAKQCQATIFTTTSTPEKMAKAKELGANTVINYKEQDFAATILALTENHGVNVIIDFIGASYFSQHLQLLQNDGRLSLVALMGGSKTDIDLRIVHTKRLQIKGLAMRSKPLTEKRKITKQFITKWLPLFAKGKLKPVIDSVFFFHEVKAAHQRMENNLNIGKIVVRVD
ncbi:MAG: NAD(P)H-quinone oxidoreductase [Gammaproteobacteria bacterium]|nr:NAD(P)H-quinone oxidoreductase [Gammaproteobacteria bacterium]